MPILQVVHVIAQAAHEYHDEVGRNKAEEEYNSTEVKAVFQCECTAILPKAPEPHPRP